MLQRLPHRNPSLRPQTHQLSDQVLEQWLEIDDLWSFVKRFVGDIFITSLVPDCRQNLATKLIVAEMREKVIDSVPVTEL